VKIYKYAISSSIETLNAMNVAIQSTLDARADYTATKWSEVVKHPKQELWAIAWCECGVEIPNNVQIVETIDWFDD